MKKRKIVVAGTALLLGVGMSVVTAGVAEAYTYSDGYGYADCSSTTWPTITSKGTGDIELDVDHGVWIDFAVYHNGSASTLRSFHGSYHYASSSEVYWNNQPNTSTWSCK
jgi:hypothetical protein